MSTIPELNWLAMTSHMDAMFWMKIVTLVICAGMIGFERQLSNKPSGIRTSILIALGSMLFVQYSVFAVEQSGLPSADPTRVMGQVVTGIGFLGAGSIMNKEGIVKGLTTAATIWVEAAIGCIIAFGYLVDALLFSVFTLATLYFITKIEMKLKIRRRGKMMLKD